MKKLIPLLLTIFLISSCHKGQTNKADYNMSMAGDLAVVNPEQVQNSPPPMPPIEQQKVIKKKIIKDGQIGLRVTELEKTKARVDTLVKLQGGYYDNESFTNSDQKLTYNLKIRIPVANFEKFITSIEAGYGEIVYKNIDARDVTDQFIDLETRLENKRNYLKRYNELLKQAKNVKEILDIEEKVRALEEEIESTTGRLKYLSDQVDYSTLNLTISKEKDFKYTPAHRDKFSERLKQALSKGWTGFVDFFLFVINIWPFWIVVGVILFVWRKYRNISKKK